MDRTSADSYVYAKACGMVARSWTGPKTSKLLETRRLHDLWVLLFGGDLPLYPEGMLALMIERKAQERSISDFITLLSAYDSPDPVSLALISLYDLNNLKAVSSALSLGQKEMPYIADIGAYTRFNFSAWPDIAQITAGTPASWYNRVPSADEQIQWETRLDHLYYHTLWSAVLSLSSQDRASCKELISEEIILQNIVWALRLKANYGKSAEEILPMLALNDSSLPGADALVEPARSILQCPVDSFAEWETWKYRWLLNPHEEGVPWLLDPRWAQMAGDKRLYRLALRSFHRHPFTTGVLVSFFKIKQLEEYMIQVVAEGMRLDATQDQMNEYMGDPRNA